VIKALEVGKQHNNVVHIGFDQDTFIEKSMEAGKLHGYFVQQPFEMGYQGVYTIHRAALGEQPAADIAPPFSTSALKIRTRHPIN
jgi:ribose transport system substrate-binding protein